MFTHQKLVAFDVAMELAEQAEALSRVPVRYQSLGQQLFRAGSAVALLVAEGANRYSSAQKRQRFVEARGECGEAAAAVEMLRRFRVVGDEEADRFEATADRLGRLLTGLVKRHS